jgi:hypothetical protein
VLADLPLGPLGQAEGLRSRGPGEKAGRHGGHESSGLRHVLRVPHALGVAPAPHVRPTTLVTTLGPSPPVVPARPRGAGDPGGVETLSGSASAPLPRGGGGTGHVRLRTAPAAPGSLERSAKVTF